MEKAKVEVHLANAYKQEYKKPFTDSCCKTLPFADSCCKTLLKRKK